MKTILDGFIAPASIAVVGASDNTKKPGGKIVENLLTKGYAGDLFLINPKSPRVQGRPALAAIADMPVAPDLAFIAIPAKFVADALLELADLGSRRVVVLSAGFGEIDEQGRQAEARLADIANQHGMALLGPNCLGVSSPVHAGKFAGLLPDMRPGGVDFISGSGATVDILAEQATRRGLAFHTFLTVGNSAQMGVEDALELYDHAHGSESSKHIMLYLEKIGSPSKLLKSARSLAAKDCVIMAIKSGVTEGGRRAAASHTGALAARDDAVQALFNKAGLIRLTSKLDMVDVATALNLAKGCFDGRRACVITDAGGPGVMAVDELNRQGIQTPFLKTETRRKLAQLLPPGAGVNNPVDMLPTRTPEQVFKVLEIVALDEADAIDYILVQLGDPGFADNWQVYNAVIKAMDSLSTPIFPSFSSSISSAKALSKYQETGKCHFEDEVSMARAVGRMVNRPKLFAPAPDPAGYNARSVANLLKDATGIIQPELIQKVFQAAGIPLPKERSMTKLADLEGLESVFPPPWVMKVTGPMHKTDLNGVAMADTIKDAQAVFNRLMAIDGARGVLVQEKISGPEVLMGLSREGDFGHLVAFGLGGVLAEALGDVKFGLAPLSMEEARHLIRSIKGLPVLQGYRGQPAMDLDILADLLVRVSLLGRDAPGIREMDINPVMGVGENLLAVDVRVIVQP